MKPTPEMIAAAWVAFRGNRPGPLLGPGPAFVEALTAALSLAPTPITVPDRLRHLSAQATPGRWWWHTSNSWLRLGTDARGADRNGVPYSQDGFVAYPYASRHDRHPDLCIRNPADQELIVDAVNWLREVDGAAQ